MTLEAGKIQAEALVRMLSSYCEQIEIAGSIRREKAEVGDIELVAIPKYQVKMKGLSKFLSLSDQIDQVNLLEEMIETMVARGDCQLGKNGPRYKELIYSHRGFKVDLFIANKENFGLIHMIRTGSADYAKQFMIELNKKGVYKVKGGYLWLQDEKISVSSEEQLYQTVGFPWKSPQDRVKEIF